MSEGVAHLLFVTYGGGHVNALLPVIKKLSLRGSDFRITILGLTTAKDTLSAAGFRAMGFADFLEPEDQPAIELGEALARDITQDPRVSREESVAYLGISYLELARSLGKEGAEKLYQERGRAAFLPLQMLERIIRSLQPDLIVTTNSPRAERAAVLSGRKLGVPVLCLMDILSIPDIEEWFGKPGYGSRVCVISEAVKNLMISLGRSPDEIAVTGNPAFEDFKLTPRLSSFARDYRSSRKLENKKVFLWARSFMNYEQTLAAELEVHLREIFSRHPGWHLIARPHPNEAMELGSIPVNWSVSGRSEDLATVLAASDVVLTTASTVGYQAALLGRPVVTTDYFPTFRFTPYSRMGISLGAATPDELESQLEAAAAGRCGPVSLPDVSNATDAVIREIESLVPKSS